MNRKSPSMNRKAHSINRKAPSRKKSMMERVVFDYLPDNIIRYEILGNLKTSHTKNLFKSHRGQKINSTLLREIYERNEENISKLLVILN